METDITGERMMKETVIEFLILLGAGAALFLVAWFVHWFVNAVPEWVLWIISPFALAGIFWGFVKLTGLGRE